MLLSFTLLHIFLSMHDFNRWYWTEAVEKYIKRDLQKREWAQDLEKLIRPGTGDLWLGAKKK